MKMQGFMVGLLVAFVAFGDALYGAKGIKHLVGKGNPIVSKMAEVGGLQRMRSGLVSLQSKATGLFVPPADGGYSPVQKAMAAGAFALSLCWTVGTTGCSVVSSPTEESRVYRIDEGGEVHMVTKEGGMHVDAGKLITGFFVVVVVVAVIQTLIRKETTGSYFSEGSSATVPWHRVEQHRSDSNMINHSMSIGDQAYRGVLVNYREGEFVRTGLAFSPDAQLVFSYQGGETGELAFIANSRESLPEDIVVKHLDDGTPDAVIGFTQVENALLKQDDAP